MGRPILAIIAFNIHAVCLLGAFQVNTAYLFETDLIEQLRGSGLDVSPPSQWGWGDHYIWRLFSGVVVTALVGVLAGAIAKEGGARMTALANIPSALVWVGMVYLFGFADVELEVGTGFLVISIISQYP
jgi:Na+-driven multidrug efflux pump